MDSLVLEEASAALQKTYGAYLLGTCLSIMSVVRLSIRKPQPDDYERRNRLYGVSLHQFFLYVRMYPSDTPFIRALVRLCACIDGYSLNMLL